VERGDFGLPLLPFVIAEEEAQAATERAGVFIAICNPAI
jgi:hypothetical protein